MQPCAQHALTTASGKNVQLLCFTEVDYQFSQAAMRAYVDARNDDSEDQIWLLQHPAVYTQGTACDQQPLAASDIPLVQSDRGGQITYHGPGQIVLYPLLDLRRHNLGVKSLVANLEQAVIELLESYEVSGERKEDAPGVYVAGDKIAALGLRIRRGLSYHGLSLNVDMDLTPFANIDPCGYVGLKATQLRDHSYSSGEDYEFDLAKIGQNLSQRFCAQI